MRRALGMLIDLMVIGVFALLGWTAPSRSSPSCSSCTSRRRAARSATPWSGCRCGPWSRSTDARQVAHRTAAPAGPGARGDHAGQADPGGARRQAKRRADNLVGLVQPVRRLRGWYRHRHARLSRAHLGRQPASGPRQDGRHGGAEDTWRGDPARSVSFLKQKVHEEIGHDPHTDRDRFVIPRVRGRVEPA